MNLFNILSSFWTSSKAHGAREMWRLLLTVLLVTVMVQIADWWPAIWGKTKCTTADDCPVNLSPIFYMLGVSMLIAYASHINRRILFSRLDLQEIMKKACEIPLGAAIVAASICYVLATFVHVSVALLR